jgi:hypothetical protein
MVLPARSDRRVMGVGTRTTRQDQSANVMGNHADSPHLRYREQGLVQELPKPPDLE